MRCDFPWAGALLATLAATAACERKAGEAPASNEAQVQAKPKMAAAKSEPAKALAPQPESAKQGSSSAPQPLALGDPAPDVSMTLQNGKQLKLSSLKGQAVVVYFYPKDDTPGCTAEAKSFRDEYAEFEKAEVRVLGVSLQDAASHQAFIEKYDLPFDLVVDTDGTVAKAFGVPVRGEYAARQTFLIDQQGKVKKTWPNVDPSAHAQELLAALAE